MSETTKPVGEWNISAAIKEMAAICPKKNSRYAVAGVLVEISASTVLLVAKDSRTMLVVRDDVPLIEGAEPDFSVIVPASAIKALKVPAKCLEIQLKHSEQGEWSLECGGQVHVFHEVSCAPFPPWRVVFEASAYRVDDGELIDPLICVKPKDLAGVLTAFGRIFTRYGCKDLAVQWQHRCASDAIVLTPVVEIGVRVHAMVMPATMTHDQARNMKHWRSDHDLVKTRK